MKHLDSVAMLICGKRVSVTALWSLLAFAFSMKASAIPGDWTGPYSPCDRHQELAKHEHLDLAVRFSTSDAHLTAAFVRALNFWATVLEMDWHEEHGRNCSIQIVTGDRKLFRHGEVARAQFPDQPTFQGWIAFNPEAVLSAQEKYLLAVHELGHVFGLSHNPSARSVMFFDCLEGTLLLDMVDLAALAARHKLRAARSVSPVVVAAEQDLSYP
jgi:hypothetical protein